MVPTIISRSCFPRAQKPLLGTLIRDGQLFSRSCFSQKTKAPARNADPRQTTFSRSCFSLKTKAPARNADPRRIACVPPVQPATWSRKKWFALLGPNCHPGGQICGGADLGSRNKISGHPLGQSASFFEIYLLGLVLEPKSTPQHIWPPGWQFGPRSANIFFPRPCRRLERWDTQAIRLGSAFLACAFVFWENTTWK